MKALEKMLWRVYFHKDEKRTGNDFSLWHSTEVTAGLSKSRTETVLMLLNFTLENITGNQENKTKNELWKQINGKFSRETQTIRLKLSYLGCIMQRPSIVVRPKVIGKIEGKSKSWLDETSTRMDASLENLNSQTGDRSSWRRSIYVDTKVNTDLMGQSINFWRAKDIISILNVHNLLSLF